MIRNEKKKYYENDIDMCKGDGKKMWRTLKGLLGNKKENVDFKNVDFGKYSGPIEENFNIFIANSLKQISENIEYRQWDLKINEHGNIELTNFETVNITELKEIVLGLKNKGTGDEFLSVKLIKDFL